MYETGLRAGKPVLDLLAGRARPAMACGHRPMLPHVMRQSSLDAPNLQIQRRAQEMEKQGALAASFFVGFPHADIHWAGASAVVVTDGDAARARAWCDELLEMAWNARAEFVYEVEPLEESLARARQAAGGPVVLLDHYDNCASGGTMDTMTVLGAILDAGLENAAAFAICDPRAVEQMKEAGSGAKVTLELGGKSRHAEPGAEGRAAPGERDGEENHRRRLPQRGPDGARREDAHGPFGRARHRQGRDRGHLAPQRALRHRRLPRPGHRPGAQEAT